MDKILFKGLDLKSKPSKARSYKISNLDNLRPVRLFDKEYQNIIYPLVKDKKSVVIENYLSVDRVKETREVLEYLKYKDIKTITNDTTTISSSDYLIFDACYIKTDIPHIILNNTNLTSSTSKIKFIYRHKFINGTRENIKHLVLDQLIDPNSTVIYARDRDKLVKRFGNIKIVDDSSEEMYSCRRFIFYDLTDMSKILGRIQWRDDLTIFSVYTQEEKEQVKELIKKIRDKVTIDKDIEEMTNN
ncbi:uncharacterized protein VNE69_09022 [Vairimorpha necatrix]|uniref:Uncharacterized protein n=1 Tax=Vairimorpha necatrix TaxID=6039 RepID=A0AAX4JER0_9MICR